MIIGYVLMIKGRLWLVKMEINVKEDRKEIEKIIRINLPLMNKNNKMCQEIADAILVYLLKDDAQDNSHGQKRLDEITEMVKKLRKEVDTNPKLRKELERYENMLDEYEEDNEEVHEVTDEECDFVRLQEKKVEEITKKPEVKLYCKNPECFKHYLANKKIKVVETNKEVKE